MGKLNYLRCILVMSVALLSLSGGVFARDLSTVQNPLLWKIDTSPPSWLFGTIHLPDRRITTLPAPVQNAFDQSTAFYAEIPMSSRMQMRVTRSMLRNDQKTLHDVLPRNTVLWLQRRLGKIRNDRKIPGVLPRNTASWLQRRMETTYPALSLSTYIGMKTWGVMMSLVLQESQSKNPQIKSLDLELYRLAQLAGKRVGGLESVAQQLDYLDQFSELEQIDMLENRLQQMDAAEKEQTSVSEIMIQWYLHGNVENIHHAIEFNMPNNPALQQRALKILVTGRNKTLAESIAKILRLHPGESHFFAVGAAHLGGGDNLLNHLQKLGLSTQRYQQQRQR